MLNVVFDMDGVLFDTQKVYTRTWREVAEILHIDNFEIPLKLCIGRNRVDQVDILKTHCGEDFPFDEFYNLKEKYLRVTLKKMAFLLKKAQSSFLTP